MGSNPVKMFFFFFFGGGGRWGWGGLSFRNYLRTVPTIVTAHLEILGFPMGGAY